MAQISLKIDRLSNSIVNRISGDNFETVVIEFQKSELKLLKKGWKFKWNKEFNTSTVYKLVIKHSPEVIQGLVSLKDEKDHIFMNLVETAPHNFGSGKIYEGVLGNLVAFACLLLFEKGFEGYVAFEPKTKLIGHYQRTLKAHLIRIDRMIIDTAAANILIDKYYNK